MDNNELLGDILRPTLRLSEKEQGSGSGAAGYLARLARVCGFAESTEVCSARLRAPSQASSATGTTDDYDDASPSEVTTTSRCAHVTRSDVRHAATSVLSGCVSAM